MSGNMNNPWLRSTMLQLISESPNLQFKSNFPRTVQVIRSNEQMEQMGMLVINDSENFVTVMLTKGCRDDMAEKNIMFSDMKNSIIKLEVYHFSTFKQSRGLRDFTTQAVSLPITLQCDKLTILGGHDLETLGSPCDLNKDPQSKQCFNSLTFDVMTERLGRRQFSDRNALPNSDGIFILNQHNDNEVEISSEQQRLLDQIDEEAIVMIKKVSSLAQQPSLSNTLVDEDCAEEINHYVDEGTLVDEDNFFDATGGYELDIVNTQGDQTQESTQHSSQSTILSQSSSQRSKISQVSQHSTHSTRSETLHQSGRSLRSSTRTQDSNDSKNKSGKPSEDSNGSSSSSSFTRSALPPPLPLSHVPTRSLRSNTNAPSTITIPRDNSQQGSQSEGGSFSPTSFSYWKMSDEQANWQTQPMTQDMLSSLQDSISPFSRHDSKHEGKKEDKKEGGRKRGRPGIEREVIRDSQYDPKLIGRKLKKKFDPYGYFTGVVQYYTGAGSYMIFYEDNDKETLQVDIIMNLLLPAARTTMNSSSSRGSFSRGEENAGRDEHRVEEEVILGESDGLHSREREPHDGRTNEGRKSKRFNKKQSPVSSPTDGDIVTTIISKTTPIAAPKTAERALPNTIPRSSEKISLETRLLPVVYNQATSNQATRQDIDTDAGNRPKPSNPKKVVCF